MVLPNLPEDWWPPSLRLAQLRRHCRKISKRLQSTRLAPRALSRSDASSSAVVPAREIWAPGDGSTSLANHLAAARLTSSRRGSRIARPGNEPIGTHQQRTQSEAILGVASHVPDPVAPKAIQRLERRRPAEVEQQALPISEQGAGPRSVLQLEVRAAAALERVLVAEVVAEGHSPYPFGEVGRAVARVDQVAEDGLERAGLGSGRIDATWALVQSRMRAPTGCRSLV